MLVFSYEMPVLYFFNGIDYQVVKLADRSWIDATCDLNTKFGANHHLATITSEAEQDFIAGTLLDEISRRILAWWLSDRLE